MPKCVECDLLLWAEQARRAKKQRLSQQFRHIVCRQAEAGNWMHGSVHVHILRGDVGQVTSTVSLKICSAVLNRCCNSFLWLWPFFWTLCLHHHVLNCDIQLIIWKMKGSSLHSYMRLCCRWPLCWHSLGPLIPFDESNAPNQFKVGLSSNSVLLCTFFNV